MNKSLIQKMLKFLTNSKLILTKIESNNTQHFQNIYLVSRHILPLKNVELHKVYITL